MSKKKTSAGKKAWYLAYRTSNKKLINAEKRLKRHLRKHPNDQQSANHIVPNYTKKIKGKK